MALNSQRMPLHSLLSQKQLDFLIAFCCHRAVAPPTSKGGCGQGWGQRAVECLIINLLYHGEIADLVVGGCDGEEPGSCDRGTPAQELKSEDGSKDELNAESGDAAMPTDSDGKVLTEEKRGSEAAMVVGGDQAPVSTSTDTEEPTDSHSEPQESSEDIVAMGTADGDGSSSCAETSNPNLESQSGMGSSTSDTAGPEPKESEHVTGTLALASEASGSGEGSHVTTEEGDVTMEPEGKHSTPEAELVSEDMPTEQQQQQQEELQQQQEELQQQQQELQQQEEQQPTDLPFLPPLLKPQPLKMTVQSSAELVEAIKHLAQQQNPGTAVKAIISWVGGATAMDEKNQPKKLSKQLGYVSKKLAPGDYSDIPVYRPTGGGGSGGGGGSADSTLPYQSFIISSTVDSRLLCSTELPAELELQCVAKKVYEAVLVALLNTRPNLLEPALQPAFSEDVQHKREPTAAVSAAMLCQSLEGLLERSLQPQSDVDIIATLELWSQLNSLAPTREQEEKQSSTTKDDARPPLPPSVSGLPILSRKAVTLLLESLLSEHSQSAKVWQLGITLLHTVMREREANLASSRHHEILGDGCLLSRVLVKLFSSDEKLWSSSAIQSTVLAKFLEGLVPVKMPGACEEGWRGEEEEGERWGVHILLWVLVTVLKKR